MMLNEASLRNFDRSVNDAQAVKSEYTLYTYIFKATQSRLTQKYI